MCGIAGLYNLAENPPVDRVPLERMIYQLRHRGPDGFGFFTDGRVGLAHARLSIIDLEGGWQPISNEDRTLWVVFNGEIFNYLELRKELEARGHRFATHSDTEVIVHLYEEKGEACLDDLNGQFAIALYDARRGELFLARDRMGIRPLFYAVHRGRVYFASEVKAIFAAAPDMPRALDPDVLREVFAFWMPIGDATVFRGVRQLGPGQWARVRRDGTFVVREYWDVPFRGSSPSRLPEPELAERLREILVDAVRLQLRADVPVGAYLSGGLDSSTIASLVRNFTETHLETFSVTFSDAVYDERPEQRRVSEFLGTGHREVNCDYRAIADAFPAVVWHAETPVVRTAPTPLYLLSGLVRESGYKVVLTGEGADEVLGGYDLFKEAKVRAFVGKAPDSRFRSLLLKRLYPYLALSPTGSADYARRFFDTEADIEDPFYAHRPRWRTTEGLRAFFGEQLAEEGRESPLERLSSRWEARVAGMDPLSRAQYLESKTLLANYLLSSQGDRMAMAHSVEGRFPFLDHRLVEFACTVPPHLRIRALREKNLLKRAMKGLLPDAVRSRTKQPYMAPDILSFFGDAEPEYLGDYLSDAALREAGFFREDAVRLLVQKCRKSRRQGFRENMALVGILSTQILYDRFIRNFRVDSPCGELEMRRVVGE